MPNVIRLHHAAHRALWQFVLPLLAVSLSFAVGYGWGLLMPPAAEAPCTAGSTTPTANPR